MKGQRSCAVCGEIVHKGEGKYFSGWLIHKLCKDRAILMRQTGERANWGDRYK